MKSSCRGLKLAAWSKPSKHYCWWVRIFDATSVAMVFGWAALSNVVVQADHHFPGRMVGLGCKTCHWNWWNQELLFSHLPSKSDWFNAVIAAWALMEISQEKSEAFMAILRSSHLLLSQRARYHVLPMREPTNFSKPPSQPFKISFLLLAKCSDYSLSTVYLVLVCVFPQMTSPYLASRFSIHVCGHLYTDHVAILPEKILQR